MPPDNIAGGRHKPCDLYCRSASIPLPLQTHPIKPTTSAGVIYQDGPGLVFPVLERHVHTSLALFSASHIECLCLFPLLPYFLPTLCYSHKKNHRIRPHCHSEPRNPPGAEQFFPKLEYSLILRGCSFAHSQRLCHARCDLGTLMAHNSMSWQPFASISAPELGGWYKNCSLITVNSLCTVLRQQHIRDVNIECTRRIL